MFNRRKFLHSSLLSALGLIAAKKALAADPHFLKTGLFQDGDLPSSSPPVISPVVVSTWGVGLDANKVAWQILQHKGRALDAVEEGVKVTESSMNCCVGLNGNPDRDGFVTLDACIMDESGNCGSVGFLERIKHPISVARRVMEQTPHVMLVGIGAQEFAVAQGFPLEEQRLSDPARQAYEEWLRTSGYKSPEGPGNHDTIGMVALDTSGHLSGSCTTSGLAFKMRGRVGDSPIIGAGLFVDNEVGAAIATGQGEEVIRICGTHTVVEMMRRGASPEEACKAAIERIVKGRGAKAESMQVAFLALNKQGVHGAFALQKGFSYALRNEQEERIVSSASWFPV